MQEFKFICPVCAQHFSAAHELTGKVFDCHACGIALAVPEVADAAWEGQLLRARVRTLPNRPMPARPVLPRQPLQQDEFKFRCPACAQHFAVSMNLSGESFLCEICAAPLVIPEPASCRIPGEIPAAIVRTWPVASPGSLPVAVPVAKNTVWSS